RRIMVNRSSTRRSSRRAATAITAKGGQIAAPSAIPEHHSRDALDRPPKIGMIPDRLTAPCHHVSLADISAAVAAGHEAGATGPPGKRRSGRSAMAETPSPSGTGAPRQVGLRQVALDDKYDLDKREVFLTGT